MKFADNYCTILIFPGVGHKQIKQVALGRRKILKKSKTKKIK